MIVTESVIVILDGKCHQLEAGDKILFAEGGKVVSKDVEIILDGERYFLEKGDKVILSEDLFGFKVVPGPSLIDKLILHVDANALDWDVTSRPFMLAVQRLLGFLPSTIAVWEQLIMGSSQTPMLQQHLLSVIKAQMGAAPHGVDDELDGSPSDDDDGSPSDDEEEEEEEDGSPSDDSPSDDEGPTQRVMESASSSPSDSSPSDEMDNEDLKPKPKRKKKPVDKRRRSVKNDQKAEKSGSPSDGSPSN